jgi:hypothetical protein
MTTIRLRYVDRFVDRHGHPRHYFRRPGCKRIRLPGLPGSAEFMAAYQAALVGGVRRFRNHRPEASLARSTDLPLSILPAPIFFDSGHGPSTSIDWSLIAS